ARVRRAGAPVEERELTEERALLEYRNDRLAPGRDLRTDRHAAAHDAIELGRSLALVEQHLVPREGTCRGRPFENLPRAERERSEQLDVVEQSGRHGRAERSRGAFGHVARPIGAPDLVWYPGPSPAPCNSPDSREEHHDLRRRRQGRLPTSRGGHDRAPREEG